jgi:hypothetical protein
LSPVSASSSHLKIMNARLSLLTLSALSLVPGAASAGEPAAAPISIAPTPSRWRLGASYAPLVGLKADFGNLGNFNSRFAPQPRGGGVDYNYDDGFVHVDSSGNLGGETWNWGYENDSQYNPQGGGSVDFTITNSLSNGRADEDNRAASGVELFGYYDMGSAGFAGATWGFRGGLHYARINIDNDDAVSSNLTTITDRFSLDGVIPPIAPYTGSFSGPGPLLNDSPTRTIAPGGVALIAGSRELDVHLTTLNFGSYLEIPVSQKFHVMLEAGLSAGIASGSYDFTSATSVSGLGTQTNSGSDSGTSVLPGLYLGVGGNYQINQAWSVQVAGRYQYMDELDFEASGTTGALSFDSAFVLSVGALYSF